MTKAAYQQLAKELAEIEARTGLYLADENVDAENSVPSTEYDSEEFWALMLDNAKMAAGQRAEDAGHDINELIGRTIY